MDLTINQWKLKKEFTGTAKLVLPEENSFYFDSHRGRSIALLPQWTCRDNKTTREGEYIHRYDVIVVYFYELTIRRIHFYPSEYQLSTLFYDDDSDLFLRELIEFFIELGSNIVINRGKRTEEQFKTYYRNTLMKIDEGL